LSEGEYNSRIIYYNKEDLVNIEKLTLKMIIRESVHTYAGEPYHNIIINDLEESALELLEYRGDEEHPLYLIKSAGIPPEDIGDFPTPDGDINIVPNGTLRVKRSDNGKVITIAELAEDEYDPSVSEFSESALKVTLVNGHPN
jgi:hypothetical protein